MIARNLIEISGTVVTRSPLFVGNPNGSGPFDRVLLRGDNGQPFIPASTLRGALRTSLEAQLGALGARTSSPFVCGTDDDGGAGRSGAPRSCGAGASLCDACRLFGCRGHRGSLVVWDAQPVGHVATEARAAVPRHRDLGTSRREMRSEWEVVSRGAVFALRLELRPTTDLDVGLVVIAASGIGKRLATLGGGRGRGFGIVDVDLSATSTLDVSALLSGGTAATKVDGVDAVEAWARSHVERVAAAAREGVAHV